MSRMPRARAFDLVVFDWEGTLYRSDPGNAGQSGLFDGVASLLADLKAQHCLLAVATGADRQELDDAWQSARLHGIFDSSRTALETAAKPHPLMLKELMLELGAPASRTLMVGDTAYDLQMARAAGCASLGVRYGGAVPAAFGPLAPLFVARSVGQLRDWLLACD